MCLLTSVYVQNLALIEGVELGDCLLRTRLRMRILTVADLAKSGGFARIAGLKPTGLGKVRAMPTDRPARSPEEQFEIDLRQPGLAALWAWLWPGAGHLYQRRYAKGILFMVCILSTYFFGLAMAGGHVVYTSWNQVDRRWQYVCQLGVGLPALPAIVQARRKSMGREPLFGGIMAPPVIEYGEDELAQWHKQYSLHFELGTLYTMIAGLLNVLAIYDAYGGPVLVVADEKEDKPPDDEARGKRKAS